MQESCHDSAVIRRAPALRAGHPQMRMRSIRIWAPSQGEGARRSRACQAFFAKKKSWHANCICKRRAKSGLVAAKYRDQCDPSDRANHAEDQSEELQRCEVQATHHAPPFDRCPDALARFDVCRIVCVHCSLPSPSIRCAAVPRLPLALRSFRVPPLP